MIGREGEKLAALMEAHIWAKKNPSPRSSGRWGQGPPEAKWPGRSSRPGLVGFQLLTVTFASRATFPHFWISEEMNFAKSSR